MKCTEKERETCNVEKMGCEGCAYNEITADEMFERLGFKKEGETKKEIEYTLILDFGALILEFELETKTVWIFNENELPSPITMKILQAINKKCEELGWNY